MASARTPSSIFSVSLSFSLSRFPFHVYCPCAHLTQLCTTPGRVEQRSWCNWEGSRPRDRFAFHVSFISVLPSFPVPCPSLQSLPPPLATPAAEPDLSWKTHEHRKHHPQKPRTTSMTRSGPLSIAQAYRATLLQNSIAERCMRLSVFLSSLPLLLYSALSPQICSGP